MVPLAQAAISIFGGSLSAAPSVNSLTGPVNTVANGGMLAMPDATTAPAPFTSLMTDALGQVDQLEAQARSSVEGLMSGRGVDVHQAMIATEKAQMGFELVLSVRNKALAAYQQVMGMQF